jgi:hypothetical protein
MEAGRKEGVGRDEPDPKREVWEVDLRRLTQSKPPTPPFLLSLSSPSSSSGSDTLYLLPHHLRSHHVFPSFHTHLFIGFKPRPLLYTL